MDRLVWPVAVISSLKDGNLGLFFPWDSSQRGKTVPELPSRFHYFQPRPRWMRGDVNDATKCKDLKR